MHWSPFTQTSTSLLVHGYIRRIVGLTDDESDNIVPLCLDFYDSYTLNNILRSSMFERPIYSPIFLLSSFKWMFKFHVDPDSTLCHLTAWLVSNPEVILDITCTASLHGTVRTCRINMFDQSVTENQELISCKIPFFELAFTHDTINCNASVPLRFMINMDIRVLAAGREVTAYSHMLCTSTRTICDMYTWNISPTKAYAQSAQLQRKSPLFHMHGVEWLLRMQPNGVQLVCVKMPPNLHRICILFQLSVIGDQELDVIGTHPLSFGRCHDCDLCMCSCSAQHSKSNTFPVPSLQCKAAIRARLTLIDVYQKKFLHSTTELVPLTAQYMRTPYPCEEVAVNEFVWDVTNKEPIGSTYSPVFMMDGFKWVMSLESDKKKRHVSLMLILVALPDAFLTVNVMWTVRLEGGAVFQDVAQFGGYSLVGLKCKIKRKLLTLKLQDLKSSAACRLRANVHVLEVTMKKTYRATDRDEYTHLLNTSMKMATAEHHFELTGQTRQREFFEIMTFTFCMRLENNRLDMLIYKQRWTYDGEEIDGEREYSFILRLISKRLGVDQRVFVEQRHFHDEPQWIGIEHCDGVRIMPGTRVTIQMSMIDVYEKKSKAPWTETNVLHDYSQCESKRLVPVSSSSQYEWKLPRFNEQESRCVCSGFIRKCTLRYAPFDIVVICALSLYNKSSDCNDVLHLLQDNTKKKFMSESDVFQLDTFKWKLRFVQDCCLDGIWSLMIKLTMLSMSPAIESMLVLRRLIFKDVAVDERLVTFFRYAGDSERWFLYDPETSHAVNALKRCSIAVELTILEVRMRQSIDSRVHYAELQRQPVCSNAVLSASQELVWRTNPVPDASERSKAQSEVWTMCGLQWVVRMENEDAVQFLLQLVSMPDDVDSVFAEYYVFLQGKQSQTEHASLAVYADGEIDGNEYWTIDNSQYGNNPLLHSALPPDEEITLKIRITLVDLFDRNGRCITDKYI